MRLADLGERALIQRLRERVPAPAPWITLGIGDDAAVIEPPRGQLEVITTDCQIEDVHFRRAWMSWHDIGRKALAVNVSDLAAMGATPRAATLSLALSPAMAVADFDALFDGFLELAAEVKLHLIGGNLASSPGPAVIDVTLIGAVGRRRVLTRSGGRAGHLLYVTGQLGRAAAAVARARRAEAEGQLPATPESPSPLAPRSSAELLRCGITVGAHKVASACMDLSDGLADAVSQMAAASGTGARILSSNIPVDPRATLDNALSGGEDYELLFAVAPRRRRAFEAIAGRHADLTCIGELTTEPALALETPDGRRPLGDGFSHFVSPS